VLTGQKVWVALHSDGNFQWFLNNSPGGSKFNTDLFADGPSDPFGAISNDNKKAPVFVLYLASASATVTMGLTTDADSFYVPQIGGSKMLLSSLLADQDFFYAPAVAGADILLPSLLVDADAVHVPAVAPGAASMLPALYSDADAVHSPFVGAGIGVTFSAVMSADDAFGETTVTLTGGVLLPALYTDADAFHAPTATVRYLLDSGAHDDGDIFYVPTLSTGGVTLAPELVLGGEDFFDPVVMRLGGTRQLLPELVLDDDSIYAPARRRNTGLRRQVYLEGREDVTNLRGQELNEVD